MGEEERRIKMVFLSLTTRDRPEVPLETSNILPEKAVEVSAMSESARDHKNLSGISILEPIKHLKERLSLNQNYRHYHI